MAFTTGLNNYNTTKWLVNPTAGLGTHTTISSALTSASSGDDIYIMPGPYTENLTLKAGVNLIAYNTDALSGTVNITGKLSASFSGTCNITGVELTTNSAFLLELTGANATIVNIFDSYLNCSNNTGISSTGSNSSAQVNVYDSSGNLGTTGIGLFACTNGSLALYRFVLNNSGSSVTANTFSGVTCSINQSYMGNGITTSGSTAFLVCRNSFFEVGNQTPITSNSTVSGVCTTLFDSYFSCGNATPFVVGASSLIQCTGCTTFTTSATCCSGSGTFKYGNLVQANTVGTLSATTLVAFGTIGNQTSTAPSAGYIGEVLSAANTTGTSALVSATITNVTSVTLTPGIWDITGTVNFIGTGNNTSTYAAMGIATANNSLSPADSFGAGIGMLQNQISGAVVTNSSNCNLLCGPGRLSVSANTTYYLNCQLTASVINCKGYGVIRAVRVA